MDLSQSFLLFDFNILTLKSINLFDSLKNKLKICSTHTFFEIHNGYYEIKTTLTTTVGRAIFAHFFV